MAGRGKRCINIRGWKSRCTGGGEREEVSLHIRAYCITPKCGLLSCWEEIGRKLERLDACHFINNPNSINLEFYKISFISINLFLSEGNQLSNLENWVIIIIPSYFWWSPFPSNYFWSLHGRQLSWGERNNLYLELKICSIGFVLGGGLGSPLVRAFSWCCWVDDEGERSHFHSSLEETAAS